MMIPLGMLTYKRPDFFRQTLESFIHLNYACLDRFILLLLVQDVDDETQKVIDDFKEYLHTVVYGENVGCAAGYSKVMEMCLEYDPPLVMYLEDDWLSTEPLTHYLDLIERMFKERQEIGYIRLRSIKGKQPASYNLISREDIRRSARHSVFKGKEIITKGRLHFTFNPTITRSKVIASLLPSTLELTTIKQYHKTGLEGAQLEANCFKHIGSYRALPYVD